MNNLALYEQYILPLQHAAHGDWLENARACARTLARTYGETTIDAVRSIFPPPPGVDGRIMGAVFKPSKDWVCTGYRRSERGECNGRPIGVWRLRGIL